MRIIGGRDFYDGAGMGVDASVIYKRTPMPTPELFEGIALPRGYTRIVRGVTHKVSPFVILLAGEAFPGIRHYRDEFGKPTSISTIYDAEEALALLEYLEKSHRVQLLPRLSANRMSYEELMRLPSDRFTEWAVETKTVVGLIRSAKRVANETVLVEVKPGKLAAIKAQTVIEREGCRLGDLGFASRLDPATTHMRISNWVSGVLPRETSGVELTDQDRIRAAGFDEGSFRDWKGKKKPRRAKRNAA